MSLFWRSGRAPEERAVSSLPWSHGGNHEASGSLEGNLSLVPVYAAVSRITSALSTTPLDQFRRTLTGRQPVELAPVFDDPTQGTSVDWLSQCVSSLLLRGNAYGLRVGLGVTPRDIVWLHPDRVSYHEGRWYYNGTPVDDAEMLHIPGLVLPGSRLGVSPITACAMIMTSGHETQRFIKDWYKNKAVPGLVFKNTERTVDPTVADKAKERLRSTLRAGDPFVTGKDWTLDVVKLSAEDAGFVVATGLTATQIANIFHVRPENIGGTTGSSLTYATEELNQIKESNDALRPWAVRLEKAFSKLLPKGEYVRFNLNANIRVDTKTRYEVHQIARNIGLNNVDELRALEELMPLADGVGQDYAALGSAKGDSAARLVQQMYLGVGKVITAKEARLILKAAGAEIDETVTLEELHQSIPPMPEQDPAPVPQENQ